LSLFYDRIEHRIERLTVCHYIAQILDLRNLQWDREIEIDPLEQVNVGKTQAYIQEICLGWTVPPKIEVNF